MATKNDIWNQIEENDDRISETIKNNMDDIFDGIDEINDDYEQLLLDLPKRVNDLKQVASGRKLPKGVPIEKAGSTDYIKEELENYNSINVELIKKMVPKSFQNQVDEKFIEDIKHLGKDTGLPWEEMWMDFASNIEMLSNYKHATLRHYLNAIKWVSLAMHSKLNNTQIYMIVYPARAARMIAQGKSHHISAQASKVAGSTLVVNLMKLTVIPAHIKYRMYEDEMVGRLVGLARGIDANGKPASAMVQKMAIKDMLDYISVPEEKQIKVNIEASKEEKEYRNSVLDTLRNMAIQQKEKIDNGADILDVQQIGLNIIDGEIDD